jgi:hypothetical protein
MIDELHEDPLGAITRFFPSAGPKSVSEIPVGVRILIWLFLPKTKTGRGVIRSVAMRLLGVK